METLDLIRDVFVPVANRIRDRADSLRRMSCLYHDDRNNIGIEGWLKVELAAALGDKVVRIREKGADVNLRTGDQIELKAATDLNPVWIRNGCNKYGVPCIFLGNGRDRDRITRIGGDGLALAAHVVFSDGKNDWVIGLVVPETRTTA